MTEKYPNEATLVSFRNIVGLTDYLQRENYINKKDESNHGFTPLMVRRQEDLQKLHSFC